MGNAALSQGKTVEQQWALAAVWLLTILFTADEYSIGIPSLSAFVSLQL